MDQFMFTDDFKRLLVGIVVGDALMTLRLATKAWKHVVDAFIDEGVKSRGMIVRGEVDLPRNEERHKLITRVILLLNITKVGGWIYYRCKNLVVVDIPEGVESIGKAGLASNA